VIEILQRDLGLPALPLTIRPGQQVRKAVIPAAGFGTRLFPASKATKKELFPIVDRDGIAKPAILLIVEEALEAGIEQVIIIVQEEDLADFRDFFTQQVSIENFNKLPRPFQDYARRLLDIGRRVSFVTQTTQQGFGHAVWCAKEAVGDEPFLLMLGDHIYRATGEVSCARQLIDEYQQHGLSILGLRHTAEDDIAAFGTIGGMWLDGDRGRLLSVTEFAEKPTVDYARLNLRVPGLADDQYLTVFGQYIIKPQIFEIIEEHIVNNVRERGEIQLTSALDRLRREDGFLGLVMEGRRYDIGLPQHYLETLKAKVNNEPLWRTLGAVEPRVRAYASGLDMPLSDHDLRRFYERMAAKGINGGKLKVGLNRDDDLRRLGIMSEALATSGKKPELMIDSNEYWSPKQAIAHIRFLEQRYELLWAEEPARRWDPDGLRQVSQSITAAVSSGENLDELHAHKRLIEAHAVDVIQIGTNLGITGMLQVAELAYAFEIPVSLMNCPANYSAHVAAALPNHNHMEVLDAGRDAAMRVDNHIEDGWIILGDAPGLGIEFVEDELAPLLVATPSPAPRSGRRTGAALYQVPADPSELEH
jgi:UTP-glucose-1-phosphate uridylyltransferase